MAAQSRTRTRNRMVYVALTIGLIVMVLPFLWMVLSSIKPDAEVTAVPPTWWPEEITFENYQVLFTKLDFPRYFLNSVVVAAAVTAGNVLFGSMLGYALAKLEFPGKRVVFGLVLTTLMIPGVVTFVPLFILTTNIGLTDTLPGMFLPFLAGPFGVFLMRQFIAGLPDELIQAARVDGAGELRIFRSVVMPMCGPAAARGGAGRGEVHPAGRARALLRGPERHEVRPAAGRRGRRRDPRGRDLPGAAAPHHARHRDDRHQVDPPPPPSRERP